MSTYPRLEARVTALERRQTFLDARIEALSEDMTSITFSFRAPYQNAVEKEATITTSTVTINAPTANKQGYSPSDKGGSGSDILHSLSA